MSAGCKRILIVDPDNAAARELSSLFIDEGYEVEMSGDIFWAAEMLRDVRFDCVIMDVDLPSMKGYEAVPILITIYPKVQIIMTAAENTRELEAKVRKQDIFYYYIKSFDQRELKEAVRDVFKRVGKDKEVRELDKYPKVLVIDDDPEFVKAMRTILKNKGYRIEAAYNKEEAIEKIDKVKPDLILLDIMMERIDDGFTICYKLKHDLDLKNIPVLVISAITQKTGFKFSPETDGEYFEADDYMEKPVKPTDLLERVEMLLER